MLDIHQLKEKVRGKTVGIVALGKSIEELERRRASFNHKDMIWVGLGQFDIIDFLKFDIIVDMASVPESRLVRYEPVRMARISKALCDNPERIWITSDGLHRDVILRLKMVQFWEQHSNRTMFIDSIFPRDKIAKFMEVPNSLTLCVAAMIAGMAKRIIIFGCDGYDGSYADGAYSYYKSEEVKKERQLALGSIEDPGINRDTKAFQNKFKDFYALYCSHFNNFPDIYNCSPNTIYTNMRKINYDEAIRLLNGEELEPEREGDGWQIIY